MKKNDIVKLMFPMVLCLMLMLSSCGKSSAELIGAYNTIGSELQEINYEQASMTMMSTDHKELYVYSDGTYMLTEGHIYQVSAELGTTTTSFGTYTSTTAGDETTYTLSKPTKILQSIYANRVAVNYAGGKNGHVDSGNAESWADVYEGATADNIIDTILASTEGYAATIIVDTTNDRITEVTRAG